MKKARRLEIIPLVLWLTLALAMVGSLTHTAWAFATLEGGNLTVGYIQAVAVDLGLFALAFSIQKRRRQRRPTWTLWAGVGLFSGISAYANLLHGLAFQGRLPLSGWAWLASLRPFILSGVLPLLVLYLSEIVSSDVQHAVQQAERERKRAERLAARRPSTSEQPDAFPYDIEQARAQALERRRLSKDQALERLLDFLADHPDASLSEAGRHIGRSKTTVSNYLNELEESGRIRRNGQGIEVLAR